MTTKQQIKLESRYSRFLPLPAEQKEEIKSWLIEVLDNGFNDEETEIEEASELMLLYNVDRLYSGGFLQFLEDLF